MGDTERGVETCRNEIDASVSGDRRGASKKRGIEMDFSYRRQNLAGLRTPDRIRGGAKSLHLIVITDQDNLLTKSDVARTAER